MLITFPHFVLPWHDHNVASSCSFSVIFDFIHTWINREEWPHSWFTQKSSHGDENWLWGSCLKLACRGWSDVLGVSKADELIENIHGLPTTSVLPDDFGKKKPRQYQGLLLWRQLVLASWPDIDGQHWYAYSAGQSWTHEAFRWRWGVKLFVTLVVGGVV